MERAEKEDQTVKVSYLCLSSCLPITLLDRELALSFRHWNSHQPLSTNLVAVVVASTELEMIPNERNSLKGFDGREDLQTNTGSSSNSFSFLKEIIPSGVVEVVEGGWPWLDVRVLSVGRPVLTVSTLTLPRWNITRQTSQT